MEKIKIKNDVISFLKQSEFKSTIYDICKNTGHKNEQVYAILTKNSEIKKININNIIYWYIFDDQKVPVKIIEKKNDDIDDNFIEIYKSDQKLKKRRVFLTNDERLIYSDKIKKIKK